MLSPKADGKDFSDSWIAAITDFWIGSTKRLVSISHEETFTFEEEGASDHKQSRVKKSEYESTLCVSFKSIDDDSDH